MPALECSIAGLLRSAMLDSNQFRSGLNRKRKTLIQTAGVVLGILLLIPIFKAAEPKYKGIGFSSYLKFQNGYEFRDAIQAAHALGPSAVPYLTRKLDRQPFTELLMRWSQRWPLRYLKFIPTQNEYQNRRIGASGLLNAIGTNAVAALPTAMKIVETEGSFSPRFNCLAIVGRCASNTKYEDRALQALLTATESVDREERKVALVSLGNFTNHSHEILPVLIKGIKVPGLYDSALAGLKRFGPQALAPLQELATKEEGHIRPATAALESLTNNAAKAK